MSSAQIQSIQNLLEEAQRNRVFSGAQLWIERAGKHHHWAIGKTDSWSRPESRVPVLPSTFFDIGSVTKAFVTTTGLARAVDGRLCALNDPLGKFLEIPGPLAQATLRSLLAHSSGLRGWVPFFRELTATDSRDKWLKKIAQQLDTATPKPTYSDLGFMLLGWALEKIFSTPLSEVLRSQVLDPLKIDGAAYGPIDPKRGVAATEWCLWRRRLLIGEVFDENCASLGGVAGHAGIFATASMLAPWASAWLTSVDRGTPWLSRDTAREFTTAVSGTWALGWDTPSVQGSSAGAQWSRQGFGHLGYPGASVWVDPVRKGFVIFLSNRIHPSRYDERIRKLRPRLHDQIVDFWREDGG